MAHSILVPSLRAFVAVLTVWALGAELAAKSEPQWGAKLGKIEVVATVTNPAKPSERFEITRAILPAGLPAAPRRYFADGRWQETAMTYPEPQAFYGLRQAKGKTFLPPSRTSVFILPEQGVLFGDFAGPQGEEIHSREFVRWGYNPKFWALFQQELQERDEGGNIHPAKLVPIGITAGSGLPACTSLVCLRQKRLQVFDGTTGKSLLDLEPTECRSPAVGEVLPRAYDSDAYLRESKVRYFHIGKLLAFFVGSTLHVLGPDYRPLAQFPDARAQRVYLPAVPGETTPDPWFILGRSPDVWNIYWILQPDGTFAPPPGSIGVQPAMFVVKYPKYSSYNSAPEHHYRAQCAGWFVARRTASGGRQWTFATGDFREIADWAVAYRWTPSKERAAWWDYRGPTPQYLVLDDGHGNCAVLDGTTSLGGLRRGDEASLLADFESRERLANAGDPARARLGAAALEADLAVLRRQQEEVFARAVERGDAYGAFGTAKYLGGERYWEFLGSSLATEAMIREAAVDPQLSAERRRTLVARAKEFDAQREREAEQLRADAQAARERATAAAAARTRQEWAEWSQRAAQSAAANQQAVEETVYNQAIESYRRGHRDTLPKR